MSIATLSPFPRTRTATLLQFWRDAETEADGGLASRRGNRTRSIAFSQTNTNISSNGSLVEGQSTESRSVSGGGDNEKGRVAELVRKFVTGCQKVEIRGQKNPPSSSLESDQALSGTSVLLVRQKVNSKTEPSTVLDDLLESNKSLIKQAGNVENLSLDNLHQNCSISAGKTWRAKSSCNNLREHHANERTGHNIQESDELKKILELNSETWKEEINLPSNTINGSHDLSGDSAVKFPTAGLQPEEANTTQEFESQVSCSPPSSIGRYLEQVSPISDAECTQRSLCIDHVAWNDRSSNSPTIESWDGDMASEEPEMIHLDGYNHGTSLSYNFQQKLRRQTTSDWLEKISENVELHELYERRFVSTALASEFKDKLGQVIANVLERREAGDEEHSVHHYGLNDGNLAPSKLEELPIAPILQFHKHDNDPQNPSLEMDPIFELRSDVDSICREVSDLKSLITKCMDRQLELLHYIKEGINSYEKCPIEASLSMNYCHVM